MYMYVAARAGVEPLTLFEPAPISDYSAYSSSLYKAATVQSRSFSSVGSSNSNSLSLTATVIPFFLRISHTCIFPLGFVHLERFGTVHPSCYRGTIQRFKYNCI